MNAQPRFGFVVTYVKDLDQAKRFYVDSFGLKVEREAANYVQFEHFGLAADEPLSDKAGPELYWLVDDAEAAYRELGAKAHVSRPLEKKPFGKVFAVRDPDGGDRFILELARNRPSKATPARDEASPRP